jgi:hypothetical protein
VLSSSGLKGKLGFCGVILSGWAIGDGVLFGIAGMAGRMEAEGCEDLYLGRCGGASKDWTGDGMLASVEARGLFPSWGEGYEVGGRDRDFEVRGTGLPSSSLLKERLRGAFIAMMLGWVMGMFCASSGLDC